MKTRKLKSYSKLAVITLMIYLILYLVIHTVSKSQEINFWSMSSKGIILALLIPLFNKKFSPFPDIYDEKSAQKGKKSLLILAGSFVGFILILFFIFYFAIKIIY